MGQQELPEMKLVDVRLKLPLYKREALKLLSVIERKSINQLLEEHIDKLIGDSTDQLKELREQPKKERFSIQGMAKGGEPISKEAIDEVIKEWEKE
jgi:hypothetical protein